MSVVVLSGVTTADVLLIGVVWSVVVLLIVDQVEELAHVEDMLLFNVSMYPLTVSLTSAKKSFNEVRYESTPVIPVSPMAFMIEMVDSIVSSSSSNKASTCLIQEQFDSVDLFLLLLRFSTLSRVEARLSKKLLMSPSCA